MPIRAQFLISFGNETKEELEFSFQLAVLSITGLNWSRVKWLDD